MALDQTCCLAHDLGPLPERQACALQSVVRGGWERPPRKGLVVQGRLSPGDIRRPQHLGQRSCAPDQVLNEVLGPPPARWGPWPEVRLVADRIPWEGADEVILGEGAD